MSTPDETSIIGLRVTLEEVRGDIKLVLEKISNQDRRISDVESRVTNHDRVMDGVKATIFKWTGAGTILSMLVSSGFLWTILHR